MSLYERAESCARRFFQSRGLRGFAHNRVLSGTKYRPDFVFHDETTNVAVVVECDEDGHRRYNRSDEVHREHCIARRLGEMGYDAVTILRYDPAPDRTRFAARACVRLAAVCDIVEGLLRREDVSHLLEGPYTTVMKRRLFTKVHML